MAELVCHDVKCSTCKEKPIIGMRYQCLRCLGYNLCQDCFLHGRNSKNHKLSHPLLEYCQESTGGEWGKSLLKIMQHHLKFKHSLAKPRYLTISSSEKTSSLLQDSKDDSFSSEVLELNENAVPCKTNVSDVSNPNQTSIDITAFLTTENLNNESNRISKLLTTPNCFKPRDELHSVIKHLEDGEKLLSRKLSNCKDSDKPLPTDLIEQHREELQTQINRLKNIFYEAIVVIMSHVIKTLLYIIRISTGKSLFASIKTALSLTLSHQRLKVPKFSSGKGPFLPRFESTPVVSDRGLHPVLSPIETFSNSSEIPFGRENSHVSFTSNKEI
ncbi:Dystrotelin [Armadillidium nasatum]|uniref:Dystrotelin n=1 Tax=Armadillidium nasatum TaxID=96803 RepID=A0A5N5TPC4_9CRUS|nr:Dystrotelin [Armadillidium nasatum]